MTTAEKIKCEFCGSVLTKEQLEENDAMCDCELFSRIKELEAKRKYWEKKYKKLAGDKLK